MASFPSPRPRSAPPGRADSIRASSSTHPHSAPSGRADSARPSLSTHRHSTPPRLADSVRASASTHPHSAPPRRADSVRAPPSPNPHSAPPRRADSAKASPSPVPHSAPHSAAMTSQPCRMESQHPDSVLVYTLRDSDLEFIAELGRTDEAHHAADVRDQAPAQSEALGEVVLVFCSKGSILGIANLFPDAPRQRQNMSDDGDWDDVDWGDEEEGEGATDDADDEEKGEEEDASAAKDDDDEDEEEDGHTCKATDVSSNDGSSNNEDDNDEGDDTFGYLEEDDGVKHDTMSVPAYSLKIRVWPSSGFANIILFDGISWMSTQTYTLSWLSITEAEIMADKLALTQINMNLVSNGMLLRRSEYEGEMANTLAVQIFVRDKLSPSEYDFSDQKLLGEGSYSNVRLWTSRFDKKDYAVKIIKIQDYDPSEPREVCIFSSLRSQYVVRFLQAWTETRLCVKYEECSEDEAVNSGIGSIDMHQPKYVLIQMELCTWSLEKHLSAESRKIDAEALRIFKELVQGLQYIHRENVIHRDIKPANIFMGKDGKIKLGDFGMSCVHPRHGGLFRGTPYLGTPYYEAPEMKKAEKISEKVDIYSAGAVYLELFNNFTTMLETGEVFNVYQKDESSSIKWEGDLLLFKKMVASDPLERPSADDIAEYISKGVMLLCTEEK